MDITHLVTVGCSFTYCDGLKTPEIHGWPRLLADKLGLPVVNLGLSGVGNDTIHRITHEYVYKNLPYNSKPFFVVAWSQWWRREAWFYNNGYVRDSYCLIRFSDQLGYDSLDNHGKALLDGWSYNDFARRTLLFKVSLMNLFQCVNIPYLMTNYCGEKTYSKDDAEIQKALEEFNIMHSIVENNKYRVENLFDVTDGYPKTECAHDAEESQIVAANYLHQKIAEIYGPIAHTTGEFLSLRNFYTVDGKFQSNRYLTETNRWM